MVDEMINTLADLDNMTAEEVEREERIAIMVAEGISETEAIAIIDQEQQSLFHTQAANDGGGWSFGGC